MNKDDTKILHIPIYWDKVILSILCGCGVLVLMYFDLDAIRPRVPDELLLCVCIFAALFSLVHYAVSEDSLVTYFLCIPIRRIYWKNVKGTFYLPPKKRKHADAYRTHVVFFLTPIEQKVKVLTKIEFDAIRGKHPFKSVKISLPRREEEKYIRFIEECLGTTLIKIERS